MVFEICEKGCVMDISMEKDSAPLPVKDTRDYFRQMVLGIEYRALLFSSSMLTVHST